MCHLTHLTLNPHYATQSTFTSVFSLFHSILKNNTLATTTLFQMMEGASTLHASDTTPQQTLTTMVLP